MNILIALAVTACMAGVDYCLARYTRAMIAGHTLKAALWSVGQWSAASVGFVVAVKISIWYLPFEALGLFLGTLLGGHRVKLPKAKAKHVPRRRKNQMSRVPTRKSRGSGPGY